MILNNLAGLPPSPHRRPILTTEFRSPVLKLTWSFLFEDTMKDVFALPPERIKSA
jgi:hypothetical protein